MSLLSPDAIRIALCRNGASLARLGGWRRDTVVAKHVQRCEPAERGDWRPALQAAAGALRQLEWGRAELTVVLSNEFVRYQPVPWKDHLGDAEEREAYARHCFERVYGDVVGSWVLRVWQEIPAAAGLASAVDRELLDSLETTFELKGRRLKLVSIQPYLMAAFNRWRHVIDGPDACFALAERNRWCLAVIRNRAWVSVRNAPLDAATGDAAMRELLDREICLAGLEPAECTVYLHSPQHPALAAAIASAGKLRVRMLQSRPVQAPASLADAPYATAGNS